MALPSQSVRPVARRTSMSRRRRGSRRLKALLAFMTVVALAIAAWQVAPALWPSSEPDDGGGDGGDTGREMVVRGEDGRMSVGAPERPADSAREQPAPVSARQTPRLAPPEPAPATGDDRAAAGDQPEGTAVRTSRGAPEPEDSARAEARRLVQRGRAALESGDPLEARQLLSDALRMNALASGEAALVREDLAQLGTQTIFSPTIVPGDPFIVTHTVTSKDGDGLAGIRSRLGLQVDVGLLARVNGLRDRNLVRVGQTLKCVTGPFHAVVDKSDFRLDLWLGEWDGERILVRSFPVGLGADGGTPVGRFRVGASRLANPAWVNPRTGERFEPDDPKNPIGEHWIPLVPDEERIADATGYGVHGTIEPESIGAERSLGCVRMRADDVAFVFECLVKGSIVEIVP